MLHICVIILKIGRWSSNKVGALICVYSESRLRLWSWDGFSHRSKDIIFIVHHRPHIYGHHQSGQWRYEYYYRWWRHGSRRHYLPQIKKAAGLEESSGFSRWEKRVPISCKRIQASSVYHPKCSIDAFGEGGYTPPAGFAWPPPWVSHCTPGWWGIHRRTRMCHNAHVPSRLRSRRSAHAWAVPSFRWVAVIDNRLLAYILIFVNNR